MKCIDVRFDPAMIRLLEGMVGEVFEEYRGEQIDPKVLLWLAGLYIGGSVYRLDDFIEVLDYYGRLEDVAVFRLHASDDTEIRSLLEDCEPFDVPIGARIEKIRVVNEHQQLYSHGEQTYDVWLTRGVIFDLDDGTELSFEKSIWFSEFIYVQRGRDLLRLFEPTEEFVESWEEGYVGKCERTIMTIHRRCQ